MILTVLLVLWFFGGTSLGQTAKGIKNEITPFSSHPEIVVDLNRQYALIVGINEYLKLHHLNNAVYDAWSVKELLANHYGYNRENIVELYNDDASYRNIRSELRVFLDKLDTRDNLLIYFSGHGHKDEKLKEGYWLPYDAGKTIEMESISTINKNIINEIPLKIPNEEIRDILKECNAKHIFIVSDSCYAAELVRTRQVLQHGLPESFILQSRQVLASGRKQISDGIMGNHSPFAKYFLKYLQQNIHPYIMGINIISYTKTSVVRNPEGIQQEPFGGPLISAGDEGGEFYFFLVKKYQPEKSLSSYIVKGDKAFKEGKYHQAKKFYFQILKKLPYDKYAQKRIRECNRLLNIDIQPIDKITPQFYIRYKRKYVDVDPNVLRNLKEKLYRQNPSLPPESFLKKLTKDKPNQKGYWEANINGHVMVFIPKTESGEGKFFVDKYEVSYLQFEMFFRNHRRISNIPLIKKLSDHHPAIVTYQEAMQYCKRNEMRLLTDEEWKWMAGGQEGNLYSWGDEEVASGGIYRANFKSFKDGNELIAPVKSYEKFVSPYGLVNLSGNVWEWVQGKKCKGGGFLSAEENLKISISAPGEDFVGFRCVKDAEE